MKLKDLPVAARIRDYNNDVIFIIAGHNHNGYGGSPLITDCLVRAGCYDAPEPASKDDEIRQFGNNSYLNSNVHQWLNSSGPDWYRPAHQGDTPPSARRVIEPYDNKPGFLTDFSNTFQNALINTKVHISVHGPQHLAFLAVTAVEHISLEAEVFLPSLTELGLENRKDIDEGSMLPLFEDLRMLDAAPDDHAVSTARLSRREFDTRAAYPYWTRSVKITQMSEVFCVRYSRFDPAAGRYGPFKACKGSCGIRPMIVMDPETELGNMPDRYGTYVLLEKQESRL